METGSLVVHRLRDLTAVEYGLGCCHLHPPPRRAGGQHVGMSRCWLRFRRDGEPWHHLHSVSGPHFLKQWLDVCDTERELRQALELPPFRPHDSHDFEFGVSGGPRCRGCGCRCWSHGIVGAHGKYTAQACEPCPTPLATPHEAANG